MSRNFSLVWAFLTLVLAVVVKVSFLNIMNNNGKIIELAGVTGSEFKSGSTSNKILFLTDQQFWWIKMIKDQLN